MEREQLEHLIRAASAIVNNNDLVVVGSQSILGQFPDAPSRLKMSMEADLYVRGHPELSDLIDGSIGELSTFHQTFGYYAQGVDANTAVVPSGWERRVTRIDIPGMPYAVGYSLEVHDLALSKYVANREKDRDFNMVLLRHQMVDPQVLWDRSAMLPQDAEDPQRIRRVRASIKIDAQAVLGKWIPAASVDAPKGASPHKSQKAEDDTPSP